MNYGSLLMGAVIGSGAAYLVPLLIKHLFGTRYRTEKDCKQCETRRDLALLRGLVVELAIKAGVPASEIANLINGGAGCEH